MKKAVFAAAITVSAVAAYAQAPSDAPETKRVTVNGDPDQIICRSETQIGSRLRSNRTCRTRAEWAQLQEDQRRVVEKVQSQKSTFGR
jgi:hypothetical protein